MVFEVCKFGTGISKKCSFCGYWEKDLYCGIAKGGLGNVKIDTLIKCPLKDKSINKKKKAKKEY